MRNLFSAVVNWIAALFASSSGAPHPIVATDPTSSARKSYKPKRRPR